jgi:hypothetical protein
LLYLFIYLFFEPFRKIIHPYVNKKHHTRLTEVSGKMHQLLRESLVEHSWHSLAFEQERTGGTCFFVLFFVCLCVFWTRRQDRPKKQGSYEFLFILCLLHLAFFLLPGTSDFCPSLSPQHLLWPRLKKTSSQAIFQ